MAGWEKEAGGLRQQMAAAAEPLLIKLRRQIHARTHLTASRLYLYRCHSVNADTTHAATACSHSRLDPGATFAMVALSKSEKRYCTSWKVASYLEEERSKPVHVKGS